MAHTALHFAAGLSLGMALATLALARALRAAAAGAGPLSRPLARLLVWSWGLGLFAIAPNVLRALGLPESFCAGGWMNLCLLHPLLDRWVSGGTVIGGCLLVAALSTQYGLILLAIFLARRHPLNAPSTMP